MVFIKKEYRIKKSEEIDKVIKKKLSVGNKYFVIYKKKNNETAHYRIALSIGKKYGIAVMRNKMKRRVRSILRENTELIKEYDYVIVIKPLANSLSYEEIEKNIINLLKREGN